MGGRCVWSGGVGRSGKRIFLDKEFIFFFLGGGGGGGGGEFFSIN